MFYSELLYFDCSSFLSVVQSCFESLTAVKKEKVRRASREWQDHARMFGDTIEDMENFRL